MQSLGVMQTWVGFNPTQDAQILYVREVLVLRSLVPFLGYVVRPIEQHHSYMDNATPMCGSLAYRTVCINVVTYPYNAYHAADFRGAVLCSNAFYVGVALHAGEKVGYCKSNNIQQGITRGDFPHMK